MGVWARTDVWCSFPVCDSFTAGAKMQNVKPILLVETYRTDAVAVQLALKELKVTNLLVHTPNGKKALEYLRTKGSKKPCLILWDLTTPEANAIKFLKTLKTDKALAKIPVVAMVGSEQEGDVVESLQVGIAGYILKPVTYIKFVGAVRIIELYWTLSERPNGD